MYRHVYRRVHRDVNRHVYRHVHINIHVHKRVCQQVPSGAIDAKATNRHLVNDIAMSAVHTHARQLVHCTRMCGRHAAAVAVASRPVAAVVSGDVCRDLRHPLTSHLCCILHPGMRPNDGAAAAVLVRRRLGASATLWHRRHLRLCMARHCANHRHAQCRRLMPTFTCQHEARWREGRVG